MINFGIIKFNITNLIMSPASAGGVHYLNLVAEYNPPLNLQYYVLLALIKAKL